MTSILFISQHFAPELSANASRISDFVRLISAKGHKVCVVSPFPTIPLGRFKKRLRMRDEWHFHGAKVINLWSWQPLGNNPNLLSRFAYYLSFTAHAIIWYLLHKSEYEVIVATTPPLTTAIIGFVSKKLNNRPWILDYRDHWFKASIDLEVVRSGSLVERLGRSLEKRLVTTADRIFVVHEDMIETLSRTCGVSEKTRVIVVPNGVDSSTFRPNHRKKKHRIIYAGNIGLGHDLQNLLLAMPFVGRKHDVSLLIMGDGDSRGRIESIIQDHELSWCVQLIPPVDRNELPTVISESLLGVDAVRNLESLDCAIPVKFFEYMACSIPFVGCGGSAMRELALKSHAGVMVENDPVKIANAIISLLENPGRLMEMGENGRKFVKIFYERETTVRKALNAIDRLIAE